jgi:dTDP-4-dehydrorhamnose 3,5-epimerase
MRIADVRRIPLRSNVDARGALTEVFRSEWLAEGGFVQWNAVHSAADAVRGVHVHVEHHDYLVVLDGHADVWLRDVRAESPSCDVVEHLELTGLESGAIFVPAGVAHCVACLTSTWLLVGESRYWSTDDELRCRWDDPELGFRIRVDAPMLSAQDRDAGSFAALVAGYRSKGFDGSGAPDASAPSTASR